jgi:hypothetical protein
VGVDREDADGGQNVCSASAVFHGYRQALDAEPAALLPCLAWKLGVTVMLDQVVIELILGGTNDALTESLLFLRPRKTHDALNSPFTETPLRGGFLHGFQC